MVESDTAEYWQSDETINKPVVSGVVSEKEPKMKEFEESIGEMASALMTMPREELRRLEKTLQQLTSEQINFVIRTMKSAQIDCSVPARQLALLNQFFESWWKHSLAKKLVVIDCIIELSHGGVWPGGIPLSLAKTGACNDLCSTATE